VANIVIKSDTVSISLYRQCRKKLRNQPSKPRSSLDVQAQAPPEKARQLAPLVDRRSAPSANCDNPHPPQEHARMLTRRCAT